jgi:hypothetical protein
MGQIVVRTRVSHCASFLAALLAAGGLAAASAQTVSAPESSTLPAASSSTSMTAAPHHVHHRRHHIRRSRAPLASTSHTAPSATTAATGSQGFVPAPVVPQAQETQDPKANLVPPEAPVAKDTDVSPGTMQLHYPFSGNGYVTGSSPQAMDDATTAKIPGVIVKMPLQPEGPQKLPPP